VALEKWRSIDFFPWPVHSCLSFELSNHPEIVLRTIIVKRDVLLEELKNTLIFQNLGLEELKALALICACREYDPTEKIVEQESEGRELFIILKGDVDITLDGRERAGILLGSVQAGDVFGEASIFMDVRRTANVVARGAVRLACISREAMMAYCNSNPHGGLKIFSYIIYSLLRRLSIASKDLAVGKESLVTQADLDRLKDFFPKTIDEIFDGTRRTDVPEISVKQS